MPPESGAGAGPTPGAAGVDELLRRLRWTVLARIAAHPGGDERSAVRGPGIEAWEVREYRPGDDSRQIDWNLTARSGAVHVRQSRPDRGLDAWILADVSRSTDWGTARFLKRDLALAFVVVAGRLLGRQGNRVGAMFFSDAPLGLVAPGGGRKHLLHLVAELEQARGRDAGSGPTDLAAALGEAGRVIRRRSLVLVVSDFLGEPAWQVPLAGLAARHEVVAAVLRDPRESELPDVGVVTFEDPETGVQLTIDTGDRRLRARFQAAAQQQEEDLSRRLAECRVDELRLSTEAELLPRMVQFMDLRRTRRMRGRLPVGAGAR